MSEIITSVVDLPAPKPPCAHGTFQIRIIDQHATGDGAYHLAGQVACTLCGEVMTQLLPSGFDDTFRLHFGAGMKQKAAEARAAQMAVRAAQQRAQMLGGPAQAPQKRAAVGDPRKGLPGTEMLQLMKELGIDSPVGCGCATLAAQMDLLGLDECRAIAADLKIAIRAGWSAWGWKDKLKAVSAAAWKGAGLKVSPTEPIRDLLELAFERAEAKMLAAQPPRATSQP